MLVQYWVHVSCLLCYYIETIKFSIFPFTLPPGSVAYLHNYSHKNMYRYVIMSTVVYYMHTYLYFM